MRNIDVNGNLFCPICKGGFLTLKLHMKTPISRGGHGMNEYEFQEYKYDNPEIKFVSDITHARLSHASRRK